MSEQLRHTIFSFAFKCGQYLEIIDNLATASQDFVTQ